MSSRLSQSLDKILCDLFCEGSSEAGMQKIHACRFKDFCNTAEPSRTRQSSRRGSGDGHHRRRVLHHGCVPYLGAIRITLPQKDHSYAQIWSKTYAMADMLSLRSGLVLLDLAIWSSQEATCSIVALLEETRAALFRALVSLAMEA